MKSIAQTVVDIAYILENLDLITKNDIISFDPEEKILKTITNTRSVIEDVDMMSLFNEIWNNTSYPGRVSQAESLLSEKFKSLLNWKKDIDDIVVLRNALIDDCFLFYSRCKLMRNTMSLDGYSNLKIYYVETGLRLLKLKRDYKRLIEKINQKAEEEENSKNPQQGNYNKFILNPDKISQFAAELSKLYKKDFFLAAVQETEIREEDILFGFQKFLDVELLPVEKSIAEISAETNYEFEKYLLHSDKNLLANKIRETFTTEKGKAISLLLYALESNEPPLITIGNRQLKSIYRALQALLNRDIGTYQSITHKYFESKDKPDLDSICLKLNHILAGLDKEQLA